MYNELDYEIEKTLNLLKVEIEDEVEDDLARVMHGKDLIDLGQTISHGKILCKLGYHGREVLRVGGWLEYKKQQLEAQEKPHTNISVGGSAVIGNTTGDINQSDNQSSSSKSIKTNTDVKQATIKKISIGIGIGVIAGLLVWFITKLLSA